jgi:hypothetical protein
MFVFAWIVGTAADKPGRIWSQHGRRRGCKVPKSKLTGEDLAVLSAALEDATVFSVEEHGESHVLSAEQMSGKVVALALLKYQGPWQGSLTPMPAERRAMCNHWGGSAELQNMRFFGVVRTGRLLEPAVAIHTGLHLKDASQTFACLSEATVARCLAAELDNGSGTAQEAMDAWRRELAVPPHMFFEAAGVAPDTSLRLDQPFSTVISAGWWTSLAFHSRVQCSRHSSWHAYWRTVAEDQANIADGSLDLNAMNTKKERQKQTNKQTDKQTIQTNKQTTNQPNIQTNKMRPILQCSILLPSAACQST